MVWVSVLSVFVRAFVGYQGVALRLQFCVHVCIMPFMRGIKIGVGLRTCINCFSYKLLEMNLS
jgi:hypothetical protein